MTDRAGVLAFLSLLCSDSGAQRLRPSFKRPVDSCPHSTPPQRSPHAPMDEPEPSVDHIITRSAPTASRVAITVLCARLACDPCAFPGHRAHAWEQILTRDDPFPARADVCSGARDVGDDVRVARRAFASAACAALVKGAGEALEALEWGPRELRAACEQAARVAFAFAGERDAEVVEEIARWCSRRLRDELLEVTESLDRLELIFEDARCCAANERDEDYVRDIGFESVDVDPWAPIGLFLRRCYHGFNLLPFEATFDLLRATRKYAEAFAAMVDDDAVDVDDPTRRTCAAPDILTSLAVRAIEKYDSRAIDADSVLPKDALDVLEELAPELPTLHYLRHSEALLRRDYTSAVEHLHRHFDTSGEHDELWLSSGQATSIGGFESANAGRERLQTALLALASMQLEFSHVDEAMIAISEAVRTAQQNGDEASLAHALALTTALLSRAPVETSGRALRRDAQLPMLLRRLSAQATELASPHLVAYASLAMAKYAIDNPSTEDGAKSRFIGEVGVKSMQRGSASLPALATQTLVDVELTRYLAHVADAAPASFSAVSASRDATGNSASVSGTVDLFQAPKGFPSTPTCAYTSSATAAALRSLTGTASTIAAEGWGSHGCKYISRMYAIRQLYHDRDATADETAASCAMLMAFTSECDGIDAAETVCAHVEEIFGRGGVANKITAAAFRKMEYERAVGVGSYAAARDAAHQLFDLVDETAGVDNALRFEARRMLANLDRLTNNLSAAQRELVAIVEEADTIKDANSAMSAKLTLAETHLSAGAPTLALMRALPLELEAAELGLEPIRAMAFCVVCESWLALGCSHAQLARDALDTRALELLTSDDLRVQARAYVAYARALVATTTDSELGTIASRVIDALERAGDRYSRVGAARSAADAYARLADFHARIGADVVACATAAARCRECFVTTSANASSPVLSTRHPI